VTTAHDELEAMVDDVEHLRKHVAKGSSLQLRSEADLDLIKAVVQTWLRSRRPFLVAALGDQALQPVDAVFREILEASQRATVRTRYKEKLKAVKQLLAKLLVVNAVALSKGMTTPGSTSDAPPSFGAIGGDAKMQAILTNRWKECVACVGYGLPLSATVMIGGLLEAILLARINILADKSPVFTAAAAPRDKKTGATLPLKEWGLSNYIDVAHELGWISDTYKDVGAILRDYRNYIHPHKEHQHGKTLSPDDAKVLWEIGKSIMHQVLKP
jgi:hypothetical protein